MAKKPLKRRPINNGVKNLPAVQSRSPLSGAPTPRPPGRPKGSINKTTALLKEALLMAAELSGNLTPKRKQDGSLQVDASGRIVLLNDGDNRKRGLVEYLRFLAREHPVTFAHGLFRILPHEFRIDEKNAPPPKETLQSEDDIIVFLRKRGASDAAAQIVAKHMFEAKRMLERDN